MARFIPKSFINDLVAGCDIVEILNRFVALKKAGGDSYEACCPFHQENTPSFKVSQVKQLYHCFGCGAGGNVITFVSEYQKLEFIPAIEWLAHHLGMSIPSTESRDSHFANQITQLHSVLEQAVSFYRKQLQSSPLALTYLKGRGIHESSIDAFQLGFAPHTWDSLHRFLTGGKKYHASLVQTAGLAIKKSHSHYYDRFRSRIIFPIRDRQGLYIGLGGRVLNADDQPKYLNSPETPLFHKNRALYGLCESLTLGKALNRIWIVEGYLDVITLYQFNITPVVATLGTAISHTHLQQLFRLTDEIVFFFDGDAAGEKASLRALALSLENIKDNCTVRFLLLPQGEDPDSWVRGFHNIDQTRLIKESMTLEDFFFQYIQKEADIKTAEGQRKALQKAIPLLKKAPYGIQREQLFNRLSRLVNLETSKLEKLPAPTRYMAHRSKAPVTRQYTVVDRGIGLLLQYPYLLAPTLPTALNNRLQTEHPLLAYLIQLIHQHKEVSTAVLLERFRTRKTLSEYLVKLAQHQWLVPEKGVTDEFKDILIHLDKSSRDKKMKGLLQKARTEGLTKGEKDCLTQLLEERSTRSSD